MTDNLFEQFHGADLERLADCLTAIRVAGLKVDKFTQAGINQSSGNVYVWSEDWVGCVYCSIGFDIQWSHSCWECGAEHDFDTYEQLEDYYNKYHMASCEECHLEDEVTA